MCIVMTGGKAGDNMTIGEVSERFGISQDTLRYYERVGLIPQVHRTSGGVRDYQESDLGWVEHAICMRSAGVSVEALIEYVRLYQQGDETIEARLHLLEEQRELMLEQQEKIVATLKRLNYKISRYEAAMQTGKLVWVEDDKENC